MYILSNVEQNGNKPCPNDNIINVTKLKALADDKLNGAKMTISLFDRVKKNCGKRKKCWLPAFSPFPTVFSKSFSFRVVKSPDREVNS